MKLTPQKYAELLYSLSKEADEKNFDHMIESFIKLLIKNKGLHLLSKIIKEFFFIYNQKEKIMVAETSVAKSLSPASLNNIKTILKQEFNPAEIDLREKIDPRLLGSLQIKINNDLLLDDSLRNKLNQLKNQLLIP